jgi:restriction endonuclease S subunit
MVSRASLEQLDLNIPSIETQRKIVAIDALAERERALSALVAGMRKELTSKILGEYAKQIRPAAATERITN